MNFRSYLSFPCCLKLFHTYIPIIYYCLDIGDYFIIFDHICRAVGGSENSGVPVLFGGHNLPPLVEIGLTDLPKFGGAMGHGTPGTPRDDRPDTSALEMTQLSNVLITDNSTIKTNYR